MLYSSGALVRSSYRGSLCYNAGNWGRKPPLRGSPSRCCSEHWRAVHCLKIRRSAIGYPGAMSTTAVLPCRRCLPTLHKSSTPSLQTSKGSLVESQTLALESIQLLQVKKVEERKFCYTVPSGGESVFSFGLVALIPRATSTLSWSSDFASGEVPAATYIGAKSAWLDARRMCIECLRKRSK